MFDKKYCKIVFLVLISIVIFYPSLVLANEDKNVLIINSYNYGYSWTDNETEGISSVLKKSGEKTNINVEYMDYKRYPTEKNIKNIYNSLSYKYSNKKIDVLIATDDAALKFCLTNRSKIFSNAPVVFCGVNEKDFDQIVKGYTNVAGVIENIDPENTLKLAMKINPKLKNVYLISDNSESGISNEEVVDQVAKKVNNNFNVIDVKNKSVLEVLDNLKKIEDNSIILITGYYTDVNGNSMECEDFNRLISKNTTVPIFDLYEAGSSSGIMGGSMISGKLQGENAAYIAIRILKGESPSSIEISRKDSTKKEVDFNELVRFNISMSKIPNDFNIINKPFSFFQTYKKLVLSTVSIIFLLVTFILLLIIHVIKVKRMKLRIEKDNEELTQVYEELSATDEELRQQYEELIAVQENLTESEEKLKYSAYHDSLTELPNRRNLYEILDNELNINKETISAILFIDLDNFKLINDTMGHFYGDKFLINVVNRLLKLKDDNHILYRLGGDEFVYYIKNVYEKNDIGTFAKMITDCFRNSFSIDGNIVHTTASIGISVFPENGQNSDQLLKYADMAMYKVKVQSKNGYLFFNNSINEELLSKVHIETNLRNALKNNEICLYYQTQVDISTNNIIGFEALVRWISPKFGIISPLKFIKIAEESRLIIPLGEKVLVDACRYIKDLNKKFDTNFCVAVNVSVVQLMQDNFADKVINIINEIGVTPGNLKIEITESILMDATGPVISTLRILSEKGIIISIDDFGTGYSSLAYLKNLPIKEIKIDKSFLDDINREDQFDSIVDSIISIGHKLELSVVAEGVEIETQLNYLKNHNCDKVQGYYFSKPLPPNELESFLKNH